jgi:predicted ATP-dependent endonuclease of OLD family
VKIKSVRIRNFRSFQDETIEFDAYTCLVGPNGAGKSNVLCALNVFFREESGSSTDLTELQREDFHKGNIDEPVVITVTFDDLSVEAQKDFENYFRQKQLVISAIATFNASTEKAPVVQRGQRKVIRDFLPFFAEKKDTIEAVKDAYVQLQKKYPDLPDARTKPKIQEALRQFEEAHPELTDLEWSDDQFYGFSKGTNRLAQHIQWVYAPAVKDAVSEQAEGKDTALGRLLARTVRSRVNFKDPLDALRKQTGEAYAQLLHDQQATLDDVSKSLGDRLTEWSHPGVRLKLKWQEKHVSIEEPFAQIVAGEGRFDGGLPRFGHGLQRSYILALLQELSRTSTGTQPTLLLGIEEPELYQHPPQCRHLSTVLQDLAEHGAQVIATTHSPYFVAGDMFESVRIVQKLQAESVSVVRQVSPKRIRERLAAVTGHGWVANADAALTKLHQSLQPSVNEMFFTPQLVLCEGLEDVAYILTYLSLMGRVRDARRVGCHFVPTGGKNHLIVPLAIAKQLEIPTFVVFDADSHTDDKDGRREKQRKDNSAILKLCGYDGAEPLPAATLWKCDAVMWTTEIGRVVSADFQADELDRYREAARTRYDNAGDLEKNSLFIAEWLRLAWHDGKKSSSLLRLCESILARAALPVIPATADVAPKHKAPNTASVKI